MNTELVEKIANSVLYEGYMLYPYRPSAIKNRQRWNFGTLYPPVYSQAQRNTEACSSQTECLILGNEHSAIDVKLRFLHLLKRDVCGFAVPAQENAEPEYRVVERIEVNGKCYQSWQEAVEQSVSIPSIKLSGILSQTQEVAFTFPHSRKVEPLSDSGGEVGAVIRIQQFIEGSVEVSAQCIEDALFKLTVRILNKTSLQNTNQNNRDEALSRSLMSAHTILHIHEGQFVSLLDTPEQFREAAAGCRNIGVFPVLVGKEGAHDTVLSSPIILYDYPQIAPESAGDFFDGTEMDEMLALCVLTLTDEEKREMRYSDDRARQILERTELLSQEQMMKVHGAIRSMRRLAQDQS